MTCNETDSTKKFRGWCYHRPTWPDLEGPSWLKSTYSTWLSLLKGMSDERKNWPILSADKIAWQKSVMCHAKIARFCQPRYSMFYLRQFCRLTFRISDNKFCLCCYGDCLQRKINIYFSYLLYLLLFSFIRCRKKSDASIILRSAFGCCASWQKYRPCVMVHQFCRPILSGNSTTPTKVSRLCRSFGIPLILLLLHTVLLQVQ